MKSRKSFRWSKLSAPAVLGSALWLLPSGQTSTAQTADQPTRTPLIARGFTDATGGTVIISGEPAGGNLLIELRVKDRQQVQKDEIVAVLNNYHRADIALRLAETDLAKLKQNYESVLKGTRVTEIARQELALQTALDQNELNSLVRTRSPLPPDQKKIQADLAEQGLEQVKVRVDLLKTALANELEQYKIDLANAEARVDSARQTREDSLVRTPRAGVITEIFTRRGERVVPAGIAKVVDMTQLRVVADVDELQVGRLKTGGKVDLTFRGATEVYKGTIERIAPTVKRMQRPDLNGGTSSDARVVEVVITFDDLSNVPQVLAREARITFL